MTIDDKLKKPIYELQVLDQKLQNVLMQKHNIQTQLLEIENALIEIKDSNETYKAIGNVIILKNKEELEKELKSKKEIFDLKLGTLDKQEEKLKKDAEEIQKEVMKLKNESK
jgi:prefoldin beta subunit